MAEHRLNLFRPQISLKKGESDPASVRNERQQRELDQVSGTSKPKTMSVPLKVMVPLLMRAAEHNHTWLEDFADDNVQIDADLHQVLMAFHSLPESRPERRAG